MNLKLKVLVASLLTVSLVGCGGGGGGSSNVKYDNSGSDPIHPSGPDYDGSPHTPPVETQANKILIQSSIWTNNGYTGSGIKVAVLDTGIEDTSNLNFNLGVMENQVYEMDGFEFKKSADTYTHDPGTDHGLSMSNIIGSKYYGIAPDVEILQGVISFGGGYSTSHSQILGASWAVDNGANIINVSFSHVPLLTPSAEDSSIMAGQLRDAYNNIKSNGAVIVHSSGNDGIEMGNPMVSGDYKDIILTSPENIIYVGAVEEDKTLSNYSNTPGSSVDYQKRFIVSAGRNRIDNGYISVGTSGAAATVSGALALMSERWSTTPVTSLANILLDTADKDVPGYDPSTHGVGLMDLNAAYTPTGFTAMVVDGKTLPVSAAMATVPAGFSDISFKSAVVDSVGRDFETDFKVSAREYKSKFKYQFEGMVASNNQRQVETKNGIVTFEQKGSMAGKYLDSFSSNLFSDNQSLDGIYYQGAGFGLGFKSNMSRKFDSATPVNSSLGYALAVDSQWVSLDYYSGREEGSLNQFYGNNLRDAYGAKVSLKPLSFMRLGVEYHNENSEGRAIFNKLDSNKKSGFIEFIAESNGLSLGLMGSYEASTSSLQGLIPVSVGDGTLRDERMSFDMSQDNFVVGLSASYKSLALAARSDKFNKTAVLVWKGSF